jgi:hypothetical protein
MTSGPRLVRPKIDFTYLFDVLNIVDSMDESPKLAKWVRTYARDAHSAGALDGPSEEVVSGHPAATTLRLICDLWPYCEWPDWLSWQSYHGPTGRGPWWVADFDSPDQWDGALMILQNPWDYPFSELHMACSGAYIEFDLHRLRPTRLLKRHHRWLANAVLDGLLYDLDESEFVLTCSRHLRSLTVMITNPRDKEANPPPKAKKDRHGIYWCGQRAYRDFIG